MNCPKCTTPLTKSGRFCVTCGHDFGEEFYTRLKFYFELKDEVEGFSAVQNTLYSGFAKLSLKLQQYEDLLGKELARSAGAGILQEQPEAKPVHEAPKAAEEPMIAASAPQPVSAYKEERSTSQFEVHLGQKWLLIVGILTMVFGVGYFLKYSFEQGWVGPAGRVAMAYVWGVAFLLAGDRFRKKIERFGLSLIGGGIAVLYFSAFAAFQIYHLFEQTPSFAIMVMITVLACVLAVRYDTKWLAVLGLVGGFLTPVLLTTGQDNQIALMTYMTILNLGLLGLAFHKKWDLLNILGFVFTYLLYTAWYERHYEAAKFWPAILFLNVFFLIYAFVPFIYQVRKEKSSGQNEIILMGLNALIAFGYGYSMIKDLYGLVWVSVITVLYACVFLSMATYLFQKGKQSLDLFVVMLAKSMLFLIITVPVLFSRHWITIFWSAQSLALVWMAIKLERKSLALGGYGLLLLTVVKFLIYDYSEVFHLDVIYGFKISGGYTYLIVERYATTILLVAAVFVSATLARTASSGVRVRERGDAPAIFLALGMVLFIALTVEVSSFFYDYLLQARFAAISVLWTLFSVVLMLLGFRKNAAVLRKIAFGLFLVVVLKVFLFDMSNFSTPYRIISFIILGLMLVGTSYLYYRYKDHIITALADDDRAGKAD